MNRVALPFLALLLLTSASAQSPQLSGVLSKLDAASAGFKSAQADVRYDNYTKLVKDHDIETGTIYIERTSKGESMGATFTAAGSATPTKILNYGGGTLQVYSPGTNQNDVFSAGANQAKYESFLTLGFGGSGKNLAANWDINDLGSEVIHGIKCEKLDLKGKEQSVRDMFSHVTIWIDPARAVSLRQIFYQPNGDTRTADYTNIKLDGKVDKKPFEISKKAQIVRH